MGQVLSEPVTTKEVSLGDICIGDRIGEDTTASESRKALNVQYTTAAMQGWRRFMEDAHVAKKLRTKAISTIEDEESPVLQEQQFAIFGVFDGHSGGEVSKYCATHLPRLIIEQHAQIIRESYLSTNEPMDQDTIYKQAIENSFMLVDELIQTEEGQAELKKLSSSVDTNSELDKKVNLLASFLVERKKKKYLEKQQRQSASKGQAKCEEVVESETCTIDVKNKVGGCESHDKYNASESTAFESTVNRKKSVLKHGLKRTINSDILPDSSCEKKTDEIGDYSTIPLPTRGHTNQMTNQDEKSHPHPCLRRRRSLTVVGDELMEMGRSRVIRACENENFSEQGGSPVKSVFAERPYEKSHEEEKNGKSDRISPLDSVTTSSDVIIPSALPERESNAGTTAIVAIVTQNKYLYVGNAGDSRCVLSRKGKAIELSHDHKPDLPEERSRIVNAGLYVSGGRVRGCLNLSRAIGDLDFKQNHNLSLKLQAITAFPDVKITKIHDDDEFFFLACDGIWECLSSEQVISYIRERLIVRNMSSKEILEGLFDLCLSKRKDGHNGSSMGLDNMTAILVEFK